jgi:hypothetical protein
MPSTLQLLTLEAVAALLMTGIIWFVQIVHYPLLLEVGGEQFCRYVERHQVLITWVVGPPMLLEVACAGGLLWTTPALLLEPAYAISFGLLLVIWLSTGLLQVPLHGKLCQVCDEPSVRRLIATNWIRTVAWTGRAVLLGSLLLRRPLDI